MQTTTTSADSGREERERSDGIYCVRYRTQTPGAPVRLGSGLMRADRITGLASAAARLALAPVRLVTDRIAMRFAGPLDELAPGEGAIVEIEGRKVAAFRDDDGTVRALDPICTHLRCVVGFDAEAREWHCPCHGSRFDLDGNVVRGPARRALERV